ncbi:hypothetical protein ACJMK2_010381 [Sinanodonta woodiana]|uniref:Uncharacterized protein n=1 Tax=Sinanodonta woodiana TaxID=1069815 RepID=A0ABD3VI48_SINWO
MAAPGAIPVGGKQDKAAAKCNYVAQDQIWKDHVNLEVTAAKHWPSEWNFLKTKYEELVKDEFPEKKKSEKVKLIQIQPVTPIEKYIKVEPSPKPYPQTTAQFVGWRSSHRNLKLDKYGKYASPKGSIIKRLNWPPEAIG